MSLWKSICLSYAHWAISKMTVNKPTGKVSFKTTNRNFNSIVLSHIKHRKVEGSSFALWLFCHRPKCWLNLKVKFWQWCLKKGRTKWKFLILTWAWMCMLLSLLDNPSRAWDNSGLMQSLWYNCSNTTLSNCITCVFFKCYYIVWNWERNLYLLTGQLLSELGLLLLHAAQLFLLALEAKLHLQRFAAVALHWGVLSAPCLSAAPEPPGAHHVSQQRPLRPCRVAHKVKGKCRTKGIWERREFTICCLYTPPIALNCAWKEQKWTKHKSSEQSLFV